MNAITLLLGIDQNDPEQLNFFVKLVELMKWSLQQSELLRQPLTIQHALFDAYSHNLPFDMGQTHKESWIQIMMEADKSGQKKITARLYNVLYWTKKKEQAGRPICVHVTNCYT